MQTNNESAGGVTQERDGGEAELRGALKELLAACEEAREAASQPYPVDVSRLHAAHARKDRAEAQARAVLAAGGRQ
jgi:hypothetical protein